MSAPQCSPAEATRDNHRDCIGGLCHCGQLPGRGFFHSFFTPHVLFGLSVIVFVVALFLIECSVKPEQQIIAYGFTAAAVGWLFTSAVTLHGRIKQHTFDLIRVTRFEPGYLDSIGKFNAYLRDNRIKILSDFDADKIMNNKKYRPEKVAAISLLNFYELIAMAYYYNDVNKNIIKEFYRDIFMNFYEQIDVLLDEIRKKESEAFIYFECVIKSWKCEDD